ncbi:GGDEF domain-containing protein [Pseudobutyrivibrio sp.]|uniref:GGDEF domain-containing protein n=1 Tax=Pseudobutyrivibrio sp. TaxID=2014367 RepID=UPI001B3E3E7E|nr:GGDEF domain-containing protein [Pseudobutyrivibrio sp.]MBP3262647.1 GGDEF domain-containing protein [Pseudobutyrivibrio sp.]
MDKLNRIHNNKIVVLPLVLMLIIILLATFGSSWTIINSKKEISCLEDGWSISRGNSQIDNVDLIEYKIGDSKKGEVITISKNIFVNSDEMSLMFKSFLTSVAIYVDNELVYTYGLDYLQNDGFVPKKYNIVTLGSTGYHDISIKYIVGENNFTDKFPAIYYGTKHEMLRYFFAYKRTSFFIGAFLIVYSFLSFSLWIYLYCINKGSSQLIIGAVFSLMLGFYIYAYNDITCIIDNHAMLFSVSEYVVFYLMPLALTILLYSLHSNVGQRRQKFFIGLNIVYPIVFIDMHIYDYIHIQRFLPFVGVIAAVEMTCLIPLLVKSVIEKQRERMEQEYDANVDSEVYLIIGAIVLMIFSLLELIVLRVYKVNEVITKPSLFMAFNFIEIGMLFFMMCHFIYYFMNSIDHMSESRIKSQLEGLAYKDALTGLMNRARCSQVTATLSGNYAVVSLDLDRLKYVNDTLGHLEGDRMIKAFATLITEAFEGASLIGRTGGDEFVVVFENPTADVCDKSIRRLEAGMDRFNKSNGTFFLSASCGYAYSYEVNSKKYKDVFYLADQRMYKVKEEHHG